MVLKRWGQDDSHDGLSLFRRMRKEGSTVPIAFHKPYWYHSMNMLLGDQMKRECRYMIGIIPPKYQGLWYEYVVGGSDEKGVSIHDWYYTTKIANTVRDSKILET